MKTTVVEKLDCEFIVLLSDSVHVMTVQTGYKTELKKRGKELKVALIIPIRKKNYNEYVENHSFFQ